MQKYVIQGFTLFYNMFYNVFNMYFLIYLTSVVNFILKTQTSNTLTRVDSTLFVKDYSCATIVNWIFVESFHIYTLDITWLVWYYNSVKYYYMESI